MRPDWIPEDVVPTDGTTRFRFSCGLVVHSSSYSNGIRDSPDLSGDEWLDVVVLERWFHAGVLGS